METREFLVRTSLRAEILEMWVTEGWLLPDRRGDRRSFSEVDVARAQAAQGFAQQLAHADEVVHD